MRKNRRSCAKLSGQRADRRAGGGRWQGGSSRRWGSTPRRGMRVRWPRRRVGRDGAARVFGDASGIVSRLNSSGWTGEAAEAFRGQLKDLPRDLDLAARSHRTTAGRCRSYGSGLQVRQRRADELESRAAELRRQQQAAIGEVNRLAARTAPEGSAAAGGPCARRYNSARSRADGIGGDLEAVIADARRLHGEHRGAAAGAAPGDPGRGRRAVQGARLAVPGLGLGQVVDLRARRRAGPDLLGAQGRVRRARGARPWCPACSSWPRSRWPPPASRWLIDVGSSSPPARLLGGHRPRRRAHLHPGRQDPVRAQGRPGRPGPPAPTTWPGRRHMAMRGNPVRGLGSTAVHSGNAGNGGRPPALPGAGRDQPAVPQHRRHLAASRTRAGAGFRNNCQSCVVAVDNQFGGNATSAVRRLLGSRTTSSPGRLAEQIADAVGTGNTFRRAGSYDDIVRQLQNAGDGPAVSSTGCGRSRRDVRRRTRLQCRQPQRPDLLPRRADRQVRAAGELLRGGLEFLRTL